MKKFRYPFLGTLILLGLAFGVLRWLAVLQLSTLAFQPPLDPAGLPAGEPLPPLTQQVVVVVVSGLGYAQTQGLDMPIWQSLADVGASAQLTSQPPAFWPSTWSSLLTGAGPELNGAPLLDPVATGIHPIAADNLLLAARDAGLRAAVAVCDSRAALLAAAAPEDTFVATETGAAGDAQVIEAALGYIATRQHQLILVHLDQPAAIGRSEGTAAQAYRGALRQVDSYVRQITHQMNLDACVLVLTSDGALLSDGRPAGGENSPPNLPLVVAGQRVIAGTYSPARLQDVAPTVAALLGTRLPAAAQGRPLMEMLDGGDGTVPRDMALAGQRAALDAAYAGAIGATGSESIPRDLATVRELFRHTNAAGAAELARLVVREAVAHMASVRAARLQAERVSRLFPLMLGIALPWLVVWLRRPPRSVLCLVGALLAVAVFYGLYRLEGNTVSFTDTLSASAQFGWPLLRSALAGLCVGSILPLIGLLSGEEPSPLPDVRDRRLTPGARDYRWPNAVAVGYDYVLCVCYVWLLPVLVAYWQHGAWITWYLPDPAMLMLHGFLLQQLALVALLSPGVAWLIGAVMWAVERRRTLASRRTAAWDPIAYLRR